MPILLIILVLLPTDAQGYVPHDYPAIYTHQIGNLFYVAACIAFLWTILHNRLISHAGWRSIFLAVVCFLAWDLIVFFGRLAEVFADMQPIATAASTENAFLNVVQVEGLAYVSYLGRFDFLVLDAAMFFFYRGLNEHLLKKAASSAEGAVAAAVLPLLPIYLTEITGNVVFLVLGVLCVRTSIRLFRSDRENILWSYMVWLSSALLFFAFSRSFGHIWRHVFMFAGLEYIWQYGEGIAGSLNTAVRFVISALTLFFVWIYQIYLKMSDDKRKIEEVSADIMSLNQEMEELGAERTFALLGLRIADNIRNPVAIIGCISQRLLHREELTGHQRENLEDVVDACHKLEKIVADFESIIKNRPRMFRYEDVNEVVRDVVSLMLQEAEQRGITLEQKTAPGPLRINLQRNLLRVGLFYLLRNSVNATSTGGKIVVETFGSEELVTIRISDTGCGIPREMLDRLFDPLYSQAGERLRMALPLVRQIVIEHLGELMVSSEVGKGTTFDIIFPVKWCLVSTHLGNVEAADEKE
ncbi:MAG TPA: HAMP domain-containing sensor histidine kinase [Dissulfurispiraceae bacterium]|nr:HAMP domain-containing sensor histidine kinase [Dissulfurispiraceae bacterium]